MIISDFISTYLWQDSFQTQLKVFLWTNNILLILSWLTLLGLQESNSPTHHFIKYFCLKIYSFTFLIYASFLGASIYVQLELHRASLSFCILLSVYPLREEQRDQRSRVFVGKKRGEGVLLMIKKFQIKLMISNLWFSQKLMAFHYLRHHLGKKISTVPCFTINY